jgi:hypothetical protein
LCDSPNETVRLEEFPYAHFVFRNRRHVLPSPEATCPPLTPTPPPPPPHHHTFLPPSSSSLRPLPSLYLLSLSLALHASLSRQSCTGTRQLCAGELTAKLVFPLCFSSCRRFQCPPRRCCCCWWLCPRRHERISFLASSDSVLAKQNLRRGVNRFVSQSGGKDLIEASLAIRSSSMPHPFIGYRLSKRSTMHGVSPPTSTVLRPLCSSERNPLLLL